MASNSLISHASCDGSTSVVVETVVVFSLGVGLVGTTGEEVVVFGFGGVGLGPVLGPEKKKMNKNIAIKPELTRLLSVQTLKCQDQKS